MRKAFVIVLALLLASVILNVLQAVWKNQAVEDERRVTVIDTIRYRQPVPVDSFVVRHITQAVPVYKSEEIKEPCVIRDTIRPIVIMREDSAEVVIPITQKVYEDSAYRAYVSGYRPSLDSIEIYHRTETVYVRDHSKPPRFSIGLQGGYGYTPKGFQPYIGVGIAVNLWSF